MIIPTKHQNLSKNYLVVGAEFCALIKKKNYTIEELFQKTKDKYQISLEAFFDIVTFLWLIEAIRLDNNTLTTME